MAVILSRATPSVAVLLLLAGPLPAQRFRAGQGDSLEARPACIAGPLPDVSPYSQAIAYIRSLRFAQSGDSIVRQALSGGLATEERGQHQDEEGSISAVLYAMGEGEHAYLCAGEVLRPLAHSRDTTTVNFAIEAWRAFRGLAVWTHDILLEFKSRLRSPPTEPLSRAEHFTRLHRQRDALQQLVLLTSIALQYQLSGIDSLSHVNHLLLTEAQVDSLRRQLRAIKRDGSDEATIALSLNRWLSDPAWVSARQRAEPPRP